MKTLIMNKLDNWADSKTQEEFNDFMLKWVVIPIILSLGVVMTTIGNFLG